MLVIPGGVGKDTCDGVTRREMLRVGGSAALGISLANMLQMQKSTAEDGKYGGVGFGKAKSVILCYLQGGPSHLDLWDPKTDVPDNVKSVFKPIDTKLPGYQFTELLPKLATVNDKFTQIRSVSYTPIGLFNHTAAIYQMLTGYTADTVSPSGQLEPPSPNDFPNVGSNIIRLKPIDKPMLPFVMLPRPLQESNVIGKGGTAGFLGPAFDPYYFYQDPAEKIKLDDLSMRSDVPKERLERRAALLKKIDAAMPEMEKAVAGYALDSYYQKAFSLILSGRARDAFDLSKEDPRTRDRYGRNSWGQQLLLSRRLVEAGVEVMTTSLSGPLCGRVNNWDDHAVNHNVFEAMRFRSAAYDQAVSALIEDIYERGLDKRVLVVVTGEFGRTPKISYAASTGGGDASAPAGTQQPGRDHWPRAFSNIWAGGGIQTGRVIGATDKRGEDSVERICGPGDFLATIYHHLGIDAGKTLIKDFNGRPTPVVDHGKPIPELRG